MDTIAHDIKKPLPGFLVISVSDNGIGIMLTNSIRSSKNIIGLESLAEANGVGLFLVEEILESTTKSILP